MSDIIKEIETEQMTKTVPEFGSGDTVNVSVRVKEGNRERLQAFEGVVIGKRNRGINSSFTVRKTTHGEGVERVFQTYADRRDQGQAARQGPSGQALPPARSDRQGGPKLAKK